MAIYNAVPPPPELGSQTTAPAARQRTPVTSTGIDIDAWTISALQSLKVSPVARGTGSPLAIPIDEHVVTREHKDRHISAVTFDRTAAETLRRPPSRRDSQRRREALLKGNEGSRQRRRWENDRLIGVPNAQPPQPDDWDVHPTHPVHHIPYQLAQYWDYGVRQRVDEKTSRLQAARKRQQLKSGSATGLGVGEVPRDLRESSKRSPVVRAWVRALEEPVRQYLSQERARLRDGAANGDVGDVDADSAADGMDSEDEEIVFVGRNGAMRELQEKSTWKKARREVSHETVDSGMVFDSFGDDESAAFKRWLTHSISDYYGLSSRSVTMANTSRKVVYVGFKNAHERSGHPPLIQLPRPLWERC